MKYAASALMAIMAIALLVLTLVTGSVTIAISTVAMLGASLLSLAEVTP